VHVIIAGCGRVGSELATNLERMDHSISVVDKNPTAFERLKGDFRGRRVVMLGNSVSGTEIASDLAIDDSIRVTASLRKPRYVIPRVSRGVPSDWRFFTRFSAYRPMAFPTEAVADGLKRLVLDVSGHPSQYGA
jgi:dimethylaniline monooxygenase (N-oxide forming)